MLKHAIDLYNHLLDIVESIKQPSRKMKTLLFSGAAFAVLAFSWFSAQAIGGVNNADSLLRQAVNGQASPLEQSAANTERKADSSKSNSSSTEQKNTANSASNSTDSTSKTAAGNSDAKENSSTESKATKSFNLTVKVDSNYSPGTVISYDAIKDETVYYGGDLEANVSSLTISKSTATAEPLSLTFVTADGSFVAVPSVVEADKVPYTSLVLDPAQRSIPANNFNMVFTGYDLLDKGTYVMHISAPKIVQGQTSSQWQYHGFVTLVVTD